MLDLPEDVTLFDVAQAEEVTGQMIRLDRDSAKMKMEVAWWGEISSRSLREKELDHPWKWRQLVGEKPPELLDNLVQDYSLQLVIACGNQFVI